MSTTREYYHPVFPQKFSSGDYLLVYDDGDNNVVDLIHPTPYSEDTLEAYMPDGDVIDTMGDDMLEAMGRKNGKICDDTDSRFGKEHEMYDDTYSLYDDFEKKY